VAVLVHVWLPLGLLHHRTSDNDERRLGVLQLHSGTLLALVHGWSSIHAAKTRADPSTWDLISRILPVTTPWVNIKYEALHLLSGTVLQILTSRCLEMTTFPMTSTLPLTVLKLTTVRFLIQKACATDGPDLTYNCAWFAMAI